MFAEGFQLVDALEDAPFPVIAAVHGGGFAAGAELAWARQLAKGPTLAHAVTKRLVRHALDYGSRQADRYILDAASPLLESRDMRYAVDLLLTHGARKFSQNHAEVVFEGR